MTPPCWLVGDLCGQCSACSAQGFMSSVPNMACVPNMAPPRLVASVQRQCNCYSVSGRRPTQEGQPLTTATPLACRLLRQTRWTISPDELFMIGSVEGSSARLNGVPPSAYLSAQCSVLSVWCSVSRDNPKCSVFSAQCLVLSVQRQS